MLGCSRRNGAFLNLGIAISAAKSLGFHHNGTNDEFSDDESRLRKRIWRTLRYHDLFFCAMMGRTSSIITTDSSFDDPPPISRWTCPDFCQELGLLESARAFSFMEETVNNVYTEQSIPLGFLQQISQKLKEASLKIPTELRTVKISNIASESLQISQANILRNACVACNYYFSMMLLTRPFHITCLQAKYCVRTCSRLNGNTDGTGFDTKVYTDIMHGAMTSIDSATKTIQLLHELKVAGILFNNMPLLVYVLYFSICADLNAFSAQTFTAALTVSSAYFGRLGTPTKCELAIKQADEVLQHFCKNSPQARRYKMILEKLSRAAVDHLKSLECKEKEKENQKDLMPELFRLNSTSSSPQCNNSHRVPEEAQHQQQEQGPYQSRNRKVPVSDESYRLIPPGYISQPTTADMDSTQINTISLIGDGTSLLDIVQTFRDLNGTPFDMDLGNIDMGHIDPGLAEAYNIDNTDFDFENMESIWDVNWGGGFL